MSSNNNSASAEKANNSVPACFFFADVIDRSISGYQVCKSIQQVIGTRGKVTGAQVLNGLYRIYFSTNEARRILIAQGVTIGDTYVSIIEVNPKIVRGAEESPSVKMIIGNIPLSVSNDEIESELKKMEGVHLRSRLFFENYRDDEGGLSSFKTGRRFAYINAPSKPLPHRFQMGNWKPTLYHWGQKTKSPEKPKTDQEETAGPEIPTDHNTEETVDSVGATVSTSKKDTKGESSNNFPESAQSKIDSFINSRRSRSKTNTSRRSRSGSSRKRIRSPAENYQHSPSQKNLKKDPKGASAKASKAHQKASASQHSSSGSSGIQVNNSFSPLSKNSNSLK